MKGKHHAKPFVTPYNNVLQHRIRQWLAACLVLFKPLPDPILSVGHLGTNVSEIRIEMQQFFFQGNTFKNIIYQMLAILFRPQCVNAGLVMQ